MLRNGIPNESVRVETALSTRPASNRMGLLLFSSICRTAQPSLRQTLPVSSPLAAF